MNPDRLLHAKRLFLSVCELPARERAAWLEANCDDPATRAVVDRLLANDTGQTIGPYRVLERVGEGGGGVVYRAEQSVPVRREVAIKLLGPGAHSDAIIERFEFERQALARLEHPNIAAVHDAGTTGNGRRYLVMEFVDGKPLDVYCRDADLALDERIALFVDICSAIEHAHRRTIVHRDLKPSNILVRRVGDLHVPKVIDFGIAKAIGPAFESPQWTRVGDVVGTPMYMSPEQVASDGTGIDTRSDVYSLGVILYELLAGRAPFDRDSFAKRGLDELRRIVCDEEPLKPSACATTPFAHELRGDLDWITLRALDKSPDHRYQSPDDLAADLQRHLAHEPVIAGPRSLGHRARSFVRRHRVSVSAAALVVTALMTGLVVALWQASVAHANEKSARDSLAVEKAMARVSEGHRFCGAAVELAQVAPVPALLCALEGAAMAPDYVAAQALYRGLALHHERRELRGHENYVTQLAVSPDGKRILSADESLLAILWDGATGKLLKRMDPHDLPIRAVGFSPDSRLAFTASLDGTLAVWNAHDGGGETLTALDAGIRNACFTRDSKDIVCGCEDGAVRLVSPSGNAIVIAKHRGPVVGIALSPDGTRIASIDHAELLVYRAGKAPVRRIELAPGNTEPSVGFTSDGQSVVALAADGTLARWGIDSGKLLRRLGQACNKAVIDAAGRLVFAAFDDVSVIHDLRNGRRTQTRAFWRPQAGFTIDGRGVFVASGKRVAFVDLPSGDVVFELVGHAYGVTRVTCMPDRQHIVTASNDTTLRYWSMEAFPGSRRLYRKGHFGIDTDVGADGGRAFAFVEGEGYVLFGAASGARLLTAPAAEATKTVIDSCGGFACVEAAGRLTVWDLELMAPRFELAGPFLSWRVSPDGTRLVLVSSNGLIRQIDTNTGRVLGEHRETRRHDITLTLAPDNSSLLRRERGQEAVSVHDAKTFERIAILIDHDVPPTDAQFTRDGKSVVTAAANGEAFIYDAATFARRTALSNPAGDARIAVDPANRRIAFWTPAWIALYDLDTAKRTADWVATEGRPYTCVKFTRDRVSLLVATSPGDIRRVPLDPVRYAKSHLSRGFQVGERGTLGLLGAGLPQAAAHESLEALGSTWQTTEDGAAVALAFLNDGDHTRCVEILDAVAKARRLLPGNYWFARACAQATDGANPNAERDAIASLRQAAAFGFRGPRAVAMLEMAPHLAKLRKRRGFKRFLARMRAGR